METGITSQTPLRGSRVRVNLARLTGCLPPVLVAAAGLFWWLVFYPGILSNDSIVQYRQAATGDYTNIRPPVMSILLAGVLKMGGDIQHLMLGQCLAALFGVYGLALSALRWWTPRLPKIAARYAALVVVAVLLTPISPLPFFLMTFWTDVWIMTCCCWLGVLCFHWMCRETNTFDISSAIQLFVFLVLSALLVLVRHNSIVLLPVVSGLFVLLVRRVAPWKVALPMFLAPTLLYEGAQLGIQTCFHVTNVPLYRMVLAYELVGLCVRYPHLKADLPYTAGNLSDNYRQVYYPGRMDQYGSILKPDFFDGPLQIHAEYRKAVLCFPAQLARVKFEGFRCHFINNPCLRFHNTIDPNEFGLVPNARFAGLREWLTGILWNTFESRARRWFFVRHIVWLVVNLVGVAALLAAGFHRGGKRWRLGGLVLLIPLGYSLSFLLASISSEFRYVYPSSLFLQTLVIACLVGSLLAIVRSVLSVGSRRNDMEKDDSQGRATARAMSATI